MGKVKITSDINIGFKVLSSNIENALKDVIDQQGKFILEDLRRAATGPGRQSRRYGTSKPYKPVNTPNQGTGLTVPFGNGLMENAIGDLTGALRGSLTSSSVHKRTKIGVEIGFPKRFIALSGAKAESLDWPKKQPIIQVVSLDEPRKFPKDGNDYTPTTPPEKYVPQVLLGAKGVVGRNILRLALYEDIKNNSTLTLVRSALVEAVAKSVKNTTSAVPF